MKRNRGHLDGSLKQRTRRQAVYELRLQGYTIDEIVRILGHSTATIVSDLKCIDRTLNSGLDQSRGNIILNERLAELAALKLIAVQGFYETDGCERVGYLRVLLRLIMSQVVVLQSAGIIPKATHKA